MPFSKTALGRYLDGGYGRTQVTTPETRTEDLVSPDTNAGHLRRIKLSMDDARERRTARNKCPAWPATMAEAMTRTDVTPPKRIWTVRQPLAHTTCDPDGHILT